MMEAEESSDAVVNLGMKMEPQCPTNDSGYCSDIFTSPEPPEKVLLQKYFTRSRGRLHSTPHLSKTIGKSGECLPLPKVDLEEISQPIEDDSGINLTTFSNISDVSHNIDVLDEHPASATNDDNTEKPMETSLPKSDIKELPCKEKAVFTSPYLRRRKSLHVFIRILFEADYLVQEVVKHLSPQDLLRLSHVNRKFRQIILGHKVFSVRHQAHINTFKVELERKGKENLKLKRLNAEAKPVFMPLSPRKQLGEIQNFRTDSPKKVESPPIPSLFERFKEEGTKLAVDGQLQKCVKCKCPAKVQQCQQRAICSSSACAYDYCIHCHLSWHTKPQDCPSQKSRPRNSSKGGIFSNKCKKSLRRL